MSGESLYPEYEKLSPAVKDVAEALWRDFRKGYPGVEWRLREAYRTHRGWSSGRANGIVAKAQIAVEVMERRWKS